MSGRSDGVQQHPDVKMVDAVSTAADAKPDVILTEEAQSFPSVLEEYCVETVDLAASNANANEDMRKAVTTQNFSCDSYTAVAIAAQLCQITEVP